MSAQPVQKKKSFEKDDAARAIVEIMADSQFHDMPDTVKAQEAGLSPAEYVRYMNDPSFLRWSVQKLQDLYVKNLPSLLHTMYQQALQGAGRQQKMLLDFMKVTTKDEEVKSPNIVIVNNIPNPDTASTPKESPIIEVERNHNG